MILLCVDGLLLLVLKLMYDVVGIYYGDLKNGWQYWISGCFDVIDVFGDYLVLMKEFYVEMVVVEIVVLFEFFIFSEWICL